MLARYIPSSCVCLCVCYILVLYTERDIATVCINSVNDASTGCANKKQPLEKMLYFSHGSMDLSQTFRFFYLSIHTRYPANFIEITGIVPQI